VTTFVGCLVNPFDSLFYEYHVFLGDEKDEEDENDVDVDDNDEEDSNYYTSLHGKSRIKRTSNPTSDLIFSSLQKKKFINLLRKLFMLPFI
ncbi:hypothetical protein Avbf_05202, partial [Armadillidium vulgare]